MARIRSIKPEFWQDEKMLPLDDCTRLLFLGLICMADDFGRLVYNPKLIEAMLFDPDGPDRSRDVRESLANLSRIGRVAVGKASSGQRILQITNWSKHQRVDKPNTAAALPEIVEPQEVTPIRESFANHSRIIPESFATDLRSTIYDQDQDQRSPVAADRLRDTPEPVWRVTPVDALPDPEPKPKAKPRAAKPTKAPQWPEWLQPERARLYELWRAELGQVKYEAWVVALGPVFGRPPDGVSYADLCKGYMGWLKSIAFGGNATRFASPDGCAKVLVTCAKACRDIADPAARGDALDMIVHGKRVAA